VDVNKVTERIFIDGLMAVFGVCFMLAAFFSTGMRPAFSRSGPWIPLTTTGRVILFLIGLLLLITGLTRMVK
jgi:hypothetical protein